MEVLLRDLLNNPSLPPSLLAGAAQVLQRIEARQRRMRRWKLLRVWRRRG